ncbi:hypothetical protein Cgig2_021289 [Carnegiea gigantea]|uniref:Aminotransferase-like plant mobile domain-containing protein n=1 Tax=Carnegiea gigantea TaxID=171969 RepID=A0A9Q1JHS9_9CARY|nr:hypothetical protein Cgig2_021288 [Carnegiea gigantea]KAJ8423334.1 hypothetical protein Cgig2_021289 [Carnegiea gigantea]
MDGILGNERAPLENGQECGYGPYYRRSASLRSLTVIPSSTLTSILVRKVRVKQGTLRYRRNDENKCIDVSKDYENYFNATVLEKAHTEHHGPEISLLMRNFIEPYTGFSLQEGIGRRPSNFGAAQILETLKQAGIFGAVGVSQFPYHFDANVWRAFCELWGPLINTLHHGAGEVGISLYNLERVGGLPILGDIYEEFLPQNKDLVGQNKYPAAAAELLRIHAELCEFHKAKYIYYDLWLDHFYREYLVYFAYREQTDSEKENVETKKKSPLRISRQKRMTDLHIIAEGELAAFLAFWLSRFVLPHDKEVIRPETFVMAALMASGQRVSLAPTVLSYIYRGLGDATNNPDYPGKASTIFTIHYCQN